MEITHSIDKKDGKMICTLNLSNKSNQDVKDIILDICIDEGLTFVKGYIKRQRGKMELEGDCIDLIVGNLSSNEEARIIVEFEGDETSDKFKGYSTITFDKDKKIDYSL